MKIGIFGINMGEQSGAETMLALAGKAEQAGVESVWSAEHVIVPLEYESRYPFNSSGRIGVAPETDFVDPLIALSHLAARTSRLRLGTGINLLPQSNPLLLAKQAASLDYLSGGRLLLGLGVGWLEEEFQAMGVPFAARGRRFDDYLAAMKKVWSGEVVEHKSEFLAWSGFKSHPLPAQRPHPPIIIGGHSAPALRRAAAHGDGWFAFNRDTEDLAPLIAQLGQACDAAARDPASIEITAMWRKQGEHPAGPDGLERYRELGVSRLLIPLRNIMQGNMDENLARLKEQVIAKA